MDDKLIIAEVNLMLACCYLGCAKQYVDAAKSAHYNDHGTVEVHRLMDLSDIMTDHSCQYEALSRLYR